MTPGRVISVGTLVVAGLFCANAHGQTAATTPPSPLQTTSSHVPAFGIEVIVTAERGPDERDLLPAATAVMTRDQLDQRPARTLADVVQMLPAFQVVFAHGSGLMPASISRGFFGGGEAEYVKLLVDGVPLGDAESGVVDWRRIPAFAIERIEALRGPGSPMYGDSALAGVVQVFTLRPTKRIARLKVDAGSVDFAAAGLEFGHTVGGTFVQALGSYDRSGGFRADSDLREGFGSVSASRAAGARQWTARGSLSHSDRQEPGALTGAQLTADRSASDPLFRLDRDRASRGHVAFRYSATVEALTYSVLGHVSGRTGDRRRTLLLAPGLGDRADRDIATRSAGASSENSFVTPLGPLSGHLRFGGEFSRHHLDTTYRPVSNVGVAGRDSAALDGSRWHIAGYATQAVNVGTRVTLHAGARVDHLHDESGNGTQTSHRAWSPRAGGAVSVASGTVVFGQVARAFKAPTLDQLFDPRPFPDFRGGTFLVSSPTLRPQRATNVEGGVRQSARHYRWEAVAYHMRVRDEIDFDPATFTYSNIGRSTHNGVELDIVVWQGAPLSLGANYAWTRVVPDPAGDVRQLKNIPRHIFRPDVTVVLPASVTVHARYTATARAYADDANRVQLQDRSTVDVRVVKRFSRLVARLDLLNVTGDEYEEAGFVLPDFRGGIVPFYYPAPGFAARGGLELTF